MEPVTAISAAKAGLSLYEAGGLALVLLAIIVGAGFLVFRFLVKMISEISMRLNQVQDQQTNRLVGVLEDNTEAMRGVQTEVAKQTIIISQQNAAMQGRPCLIGSGAHPRPATLPSLGGH
jgi:predicted PurR-regulated permease PerM